jgi:hypothetical protein
VLVSDAAPLLHKDIRPKQCSRSETRFPRRIFPGRSIGRAPKKNGKILDAPNVIGLCLGHKIADRHVFDHAPPQRADALIGHAILLSVPRLSNPRSSDRTTSPVTPSVPGTTLRAALYRESGFVRLTHFRHRADKKREVTRILRLFITVVEAAQMSQFSRFS